MAKSKQDTTDDAADVINVDLKSEKKSGKRKYTKGTKALQGFGRAVNKGLKEVANSIADGATEYQDRAEESADDHKNGMISDFPENFTYAVGKAVEGAAMAPYEMAKIFFERDDDDDDD